MAKKAADTLLSLKGERLEAWTFDTEKGGVGVSYKNCEVKDGCFLRGTYGVGITFDEACEDYLSQIRGQTLVFDACSSKRHEVKVLC